MKTPRQRVTRRAVRQHAEAAHPTHDSELPRLRRIKGQLEGLERMIAEKRYCMDILAQVKAARSALAALQGSVLKRHLEGCVQAALQSKSSFDAARKIEEISHLLAK